MIESFLNDICKIRNDYNSAVGSKKITNRAGYINQKLNDLGIETHVDKFYDENTRKKIESFGTGFISFFKRLFLLNKKYYHNIEVFFSSDDLYNDETIVFTAHHDVLNVDSQNCQDNTASVVNLMEFCRYLLDKKKLKQNVLIVFTDCEECGMFGAKRLSERILNHEFGIVQYVINSELTGKGHTIWCEDIDGGDDLENKIINLPRRSCPPNDSVVFRKFGIKSLCFGLLPSLEFNSNTPKTWMICHSRNDVIEKVSTHDMKNYVEYLKKFV